VGRTVKSIQALNYSRSVIAICVPLLDDDTVDAIGKIEDNRIVLLRQEGRGIGNARNTILRCTTADYYYFIDSDDYLIPETVASYIEDIVRHPDACLRYSGCIKVHPRKPDGGRIVRVPHGSKLFRWLALENFISTGSVMISSTIYSTVGGFDENHRHAEDWDFWLKILKRYPFRMIQGASFVYRETKLGRLYPREHWRVEDLVIRAHCTDFCRRTLALALARGRYGLYYLRTLGLRWKSGGKALLPPVDLLCLPLLLLFRLVRQLRFGIDRRASCDALAMRATDATSSLADPR